MVGKNSHSRRILLFLAHGYEELAAVVCLKQMREAGLPVSLVGLSSVFVKGSHGLLIQPDHSLAEICQMGGALGVIIPGGYQCAASLAIDPRVHQFLEEVLDGNGFVALMATAVASFNQANFSSTAEGRYIEQGDRTLDEFVDYLIAMGNQLAFRV